MCLVQLHERRLSGAYDIFFTNLWFVGIQKENYFSGNIVNLEKGNIQIIAETLSTMIDADVYQIKEVDAYPFDYHECTSRASEELKIMLVHKY